MHKQNIQPSFVEFGDFSVALEKILYFWARNESVQCYLQGSCIPLLVNTPRPFDIMGVIHKRHLQLVAIGDFYINSLNVSYFWQRENGIQVFFDFPLPLTGRCNDGRIDLLTGVAQPSDFATK